VADDLNDPSVMKTNAQDCTVHCITINPLEGISHSHEKKPVLVKVPLQQRLPSNYFFATLSEITGPFPKIHHTPTEISEMVQKMWIIMDKTVLTTTAD